MINQRENRVYIGVERGREGVEVRAAEGASKRAHHSPPKTLPAAVPRLGLLAESLF